MPLKLDEMHWSRNPDSSIDHMPVLSSRSLCFAWDGLLAARPAARQISFACWLLTANMGHTIFTEQDPSARYTMLS